MWNTYCKSENVSKDGKTIVFNGRIKKVTLLEMIKHNHLVNWTIPILVFGMYHVLDFNVDLNLNETVRISIATAELEFFLIWNLLVISNFGYFIYQHFLPTMVFKDDRNHYFAVKQRKSRKIFKAVDTRYIFWSFKGLYKLSAHTPSQNKAFKYLQLNQSEIKALKEGSILVSKGIVPLFWNKKTKQFSFESSALTCFVGLVLCNNEAGNKVIDINGSLSSDLVDDLNNVNTAVKDGVYAVYRMKFDKQFLGKFVKTNKTVSGQTVPSLLGNAAFAVFKQMPRTVQPATVKIRAYRFNFNTWKSLVSSFLD